MREIAMPDIEAALGHHAFLRNLARSLLGADDRADDLVQEAYVAALEGGPQDPARVRGWMAGVMRRRAAGLWRRRGVEDRNRERIARPSDVPSVEDVTLREEVRRDVVQAMLAVGEPSRSALVLRYYEGLPPREVAARLGVPVETARTRTKRGLAAMRAQLDARHGSRSAWATPLAGATGLTAAPAAAGVLSLLAVVLTVAVLAAGTVFLAKGLWSPAPNPPPIVPVGDSGSLEDGDKSPAGPVLEGRASAETKNRPRLPDGTSRIVGRVLRRGVSIDAKLALRRLEGVEVEAWNVLDHDHEALLQDPVRVAEATAQGGFAIEQLPPGWYLLTVDLGDARPLGRTVRIWQDGLTADGTLRVSSGAQSLAARVTYADGTPFTGLVRLNQRDDEKGDATMAHVYAETDEGGNVRFGGLRVGWAGLCVRTQDGAVVWARVDLPTADMFAFAVDRAGEPCNGLVVDAATGTPLPGVKLKFGLHENRGVPGGMAVGLAWRLNRHLTTDAQGRFAVRLPATGEHHLTAELPGYKREWLRSKGQGPIRIELTRAFLVSGRVVEKGTERGVAALRVYGRRKRGSYFQSPVGPARTDGQGRFELAGLEPGEAMVYAIGDGWCSERLAAALDEGFNPCILSLPAAGLSDARLEVTAAATVTGRVTDKSGHPLPGLRVVLFLPDDEQWHLRDKGDRLFNSNKPVVTDAQGRFTMCDAPPGAPWRVRASGPAVLGTLSEVFTTEAGQTLDVDVKAFRHLPGRRLIVTVLAEQDDRPIEGVRVSLYHLRSNGSGTIGVMGTTDTAGHAFLSPLTDAPMGIRLGGVMVKLKNERPIPFKLDEGSETRMVVRAQRMALIRGRVNVPEGATAWFVHFELLPVTGRQGERMSSIRAQDDGTFAVPVSRSGPWKLIATLSHRGKELRAEVVVQAGDDHVVLDLVADAAAGPVEEQPLPWIFTVVGPNGNSVPHVNLRLIRSTGYSGTELSAGGTFEVTFRGDPPTFAMEASVARDATGQPLAYGAVIVGPLVGTPGGGAAVLQMGPSKTIRGTVSIDGKPAAKGLEVEARPALEGAMADWRRTSAHAKTYTDAEGAFLLEGLGPYEYAIVAGEFEGLLKTPAPVFAAGSTDARVELRRSLSATVTVTGLDGAPLAKARVRLTEPESSRNMFGRLSRRTIDRYTDAEGRALMVGLDSHLSYTLDVSGPRGRGLFRNRTKGWSPADTTVSLEASLSVEGTVTFPDGSPFTGARVHARGIVKGGGSGMATTDEAGHFLVQGLRPGAIKVRAWFGRMRSEEQTVAAGTRGLRFELERGVHLKVLIEGWPEDGLGGVPYRYHREMPEGGQHGDSAGGSSIARDGTMDLPGLQPGAVYTFYVGPLADGRIACRTGVELDEPEMSVALPLMAGGVIEGSVGRLAVDAKRVYILVRCGTEDSELHRSETVAPDGSFRVDGLPPGPLFASAVLKGEGRQRTAGPQVECEAGETIQLVVPSR